MTEADAAKRSAILQDIARKLPEYALVLEKIDQRLWDVEHPWTPRAKGPDRTTDGIECGPLANYVVP